MKSLLFRWGLFAALGVLLNSCTQPGIIGSDLLKGDQIGVSFTDTLPFIAYVQLTDSVKTYGSDLGEQLNSYLCGQFADPVFGLSSAVINAQLVLNGGNPPNFEGATLDSMVLILPYVASRVYGDTTEAYQLEVYLLDEDMLDTANYYSNKTFAATQLIGSTTIFPSPSDSLEILIHGSDTMGTQLVVPQVRIRMDDAFAQSILTEDTLVLESDTSFLEKYKGIQIRGASQNKGMLSFNLNSSLAGLTVYITTSIRFSVNTPLSIPAPASDGKFPRIIPAPRQMPFSRILPYATACCSCRAHPDSEWCWNSPTSACWKTSLSTARSWSLRS
ncbi:MAG: DUF4270 family protein [Saprospirales bacterium]|nr:DUF4270 family protein [Saprospirales bacterium]